jgi:eukaryotic-like serine/threonine-protein kinase
MSADRDSVEQLLAAISDGHAIDWDQAARSSDPLQSSRVAALRDVHRIAEFSRGLQRAPELHDGPQRWGELLLLERIGAGSHAEVYRAWDPPLQREVALKLMHEDLDASTLLEEGRAAARIRHPHVVTVHGIDRRDDRVGLWMELVRGTALDQDVRARGPLTPAAAARLGIEIGGALAAVHAAGVLHRDIKPANIVRDTEGRCVLADFGLGVRWNEAASRSIGPTGTPMYMAPESFTGAPATERSDVYSLGLVLWFALAGKHPFEAQTVAERVRIAAGGPRPSLRELRPDLPPALVLVVERAIATNPAERFASAGQLVEALERASTATAVPVAAPRRGRALRIAVVALGLLAVAFGLWRSRATERKQAVAPPAVAVAPPSALAAPTYNVDASFLRRGTEGSTHLVTGDRVRPGDRLSLELRTTRPAWVYVLNEDERGERYLLFPQPRFDTKNPLAADQSFVLPGPVGGRENAWTVTSAGGREYFLVVASPEPVGELEAELSRLPAPTPGKPITYAKVGDGTIELLRGVGGVSEVPAGTAAPAPRSRAFDRFRALAARETGVRGVWVRQIVLENPGR